MWGGFGAWAVAIEAHERIIAIAPLCGGGEEANAANLRDIAVWAFHGELDEVIPIASCESMVEAVRRAGGDAKLTRLPDAGHNITSLVYDKSEVFEWLLKPHRVDGIQVEATAKP